MKWGTQEGANQALAERAALVITVSRLSVRIADLEKRIDKLENILEGLMDDGK